MATKKTEAKTENKAYIEELFALWAQTAKSGTVYYSNKELVAFFTKEPENGRPNFTIYRKDENGKREEKACGALWLNKAKSGAVYFAGNFDGEKVVGFPGDRKNEKAPTIKVYAKAALDSKDGDKPAQQELPF